MLPGAIAAIVSRLKSAMGGPHGFSDKDVKEKIVETNPTFMTIQAAVLAALRNKKAFRDPTAQSESKSSHNQRAMIPTMGYLVWQKAATEPDFILRSKLFDVTPPQAARAAKIAGSTANGLIVEDEDPYPSDTGYNGSSAHGIYNVDKHDQKEMGKKILAVPTMSPIDISVQTGNWLASPVPMNDERFYDLIHIDVSPGILPEKVC